MRSTRNPESRGFILLPIHLLLCGDSTVSFWMLLTLSASSHRGVWQVLGRDGLPCVFSMLSTKHSWLRILAYKVPLLPFQFWRHGLTNNPVCLSSSCLTFWGGGIIGGHPPCLAYRGFWWAWWKRVHGCVIKRILTVPRRTPGSLLKTWETQRLQRAAEGLFICWLVWFGFCFVVILFCFVSIKKETSWHCIGLTVRFKGPGANPADLKQAKQISTTYGLHSKNPLPLKNSKKWNPVKQTYYCVCIWVRES